MPSEELALAAKQQLVREQWARRHIALLEDCERVDDICIERGTLDPEDPGHQRDLAFRNDFLREQREVLTRAHLEHLRLRRAVSVAPGRRIRTAARSPRRRSIRSSRAKARAPDDGDPPGSSDVRPALRVISRAAFRAELERAGL